MTLEPQDSNGEVVAALKAEVAEWRPSRVPSLVELNGRWTDAWRQPVMRASAMGAVALALVLLLSLVVVVAVPSDIGWIAPVKDHLTHIP